MIGKGAKNIKIIIKVSKPATSVKIKKHELLRTLSQYIIILIFFAADEDYKEEIISLTFSQDDTQMCFNVSIIDDNIYEQDEVFFANLTTNDSKVTLSPHLTNLTIKSDDGIANYIKSSKFAEPCHIKIQKYSNTGQD